MLRLQLLPLRCGLLCLCLLLWAPLTVRAQDPTLLVVRQDGSEGAFETISDALDEIPKDPDGPYIIEIRDDGTYEEEVKVNIHSSASATLTIRAGAGNTPSILSNKNKKPALKISSPFVVVEGLILLGGSRSPGLHIDWADDVTVRDCDIHGAKEHDAPGLYVQGAQRVLIEDNLIHDNVGILVFDAEDGANTIRNNRIYDNEKRGIWIYKGTANTTVVNNTLYHNKVEIHREGEQEERGGWGGKHIPQQHRRSPPEQGLLRAGEHERRRQSARRHRVRLQPVLRRGWRHSCRPFSQSGSG
jgi:parallel beta-helix repeat protein